jgi:hypothetical protein
MATCTVSYRLIPLLTHVNFRYTTFDPCQVPLDINFNVYDIFLGFCFLVIKTFFLFFMILLSSGCKFLSCEEH